MDIQKLFHIMLPFYALDDKEVLKITGSKAWDKIIEEILAVRCNSILFEKKKLDLQEILFPQNGDGKKFYQDAKKHDVSSFGDALRFIEMNSEKTDDSGFYAKLKLYFLQEGFIHIGEKTQTTEMAILLKWIDGYETLSRSALDCLNDTKISTLHCLRQHKLNISLIIIQELGMWLNTRGFPILYR